MSKKLKTFLILSLFFGVTALLIFALTRSNLVVLNPAGSIGAQQKDLLIKATLLMLIVVIPVFILTFAFAWRYREGNKKAKYSPDLDGNIFAETIWWAIPLAIIVVISLMTWKSSHDLDPFKQIDSANKTMKIQVVAMQWKWLFIYPEHNIATVNYVEFPEKTPVDFEITSDAPMNSFWIPKLGGQVYAMSGMSTHLNLIADQPGTFDGVSANLSGEGFAGMKFTAKASSQADFSNWLSSVKQSPHLLYEKDYEELAKPSTNNPAKLFSARDPDLYEKIVRKYSDHGHNDSHESANQEGHAH